MQSEAQSSVTVTVGARIERVECRLNYNTAIQAVAPHEALEYIDNLLSHFARGIFCYLESSRPSCYA